MSRYTDTDDDVGLREAETLAGRGQPDPQPVRAAPTTIGPMADFLSNRLHLDTIVLRRR